MAHLLRGKQAGVQNDLSLGLASDVFAIDDLARFGINSQVCSLAYDPVQSLLAVGTRDTKYGPGQIYVFGQGRIEIAYKLPARASAVSIQFCADKLICLDSKHDLSMFSLEARRLLASHSPAGVTSALCTDPMMDYALIGLQSGDILTYDMDRQQLAPLRIPYLWAQFDPRARVSPVVSLALHPRDIGKLLIGYQHGAVMYSFKQNKAQNFYLYEVPPGAPGGDGDPSTMNMPRRPKLTQALWHPTGTFIMTAHEDSSLVFWDPKDGRLLMARTLGDTHVNRPGASLGNAGATNSGKEPIFRVAWCANVDPDDTAILVSGGAMKYLPTKGMTLFEMGRTPNYSTSSWEVLAQHFESPKRQRILPTPPNVEVVDFCLIPRSSPHFAGAQDPIAMVAVLSSGELITLSFPSGIPISPTNQLHVSLTFLHPFVRTLRVSPMPRARWLGMVESRSQGPLILKGGAIAPRPTKRFEGRSIIQTAHADGTIRIWDIGHADELENDRVLQVDLAKAVGRYDNLDISDMSLSGASGELAVGLKSGEFAVFRWMRNRRAGQEPPPGETDNWPNALTNIIERAESTLKEGLCPFTLLNMDNGPITAVKVSDVGFVVAGSEGGGIAVIDLRGPAIIFNEKIEDLGRGGGHLLGANRRRSNTGHHHGKAHYITALEFSVMSLEGEDYSSILLHAGTNLGHLITFKVLPDPSGRYSVQYVGSNVLEGQVLHISPIQSKSGRFAGATQEAVGGLRTGLKVDGVLVVATKSELRIFKPPAHKGAHKSFDNAFLHAGTVSQYQDRGYAFVGVFGDATAKAFTLPALRELASQKIDQALDPRRLGEAVLSPYGEIIGFSGPSEIAQLSVWGSGEKLNRSPDMLFNPQALIPPRPTISNFQWVSGVQYVTPSDMDILIGGPDRPPSKRMIAQARADDQAARDSKRAAGSSSAAAAAGDDEGYWAYMQRQVQERTEKLGIMGDGMQNLQDNSANWAADVTSFVNKQKRNLVLGAVKGKFGI